MFPKRTMASVAIVLANEFFIYRCDKLDNAIDKCMNEAFSGEKISLERKQRIVDKFVELMDIAAKEKI